MYADSFQINLENYLKRKRNFEARVSTMVGYIKNTGTCRSQFIAQYFNSPLVKECGVCDNCINKKSTEISTEEFQYISTYIFQQIKLSPASANELLENSSGIKKDKFWKVIHYLQGEKKITVNGEGEIQTVNK